MEARWREEKKTDLCSVLSPGLSLSRLTQPRPRPLRKHWPGAGGDRHGQTGGVQPGVQWCGGGGGGGVPAVPAVHSLQVHHHNGQSLYSHRRVGMTGGRPGQSDDN